MEKVIILIAEKLVNGTVGFKFNRDKVFLDSNIILYSYSKTELDKSDIANTLIFAIENQITIINPFR